PTDDLHAGGLLQLTVEVGEPHTPALQVSPLVQALPSLHGLLSGCLASAGQAVDVSLQVSATSQLRLAGRQRVPALLSGCTHAPSYDSHTSEVPPRPSSVQPTTSAPHTPLLHVAVSVAPAPV